MNHSQVDLAAIARQDMMERGFEPDLPAAALEQAQNARQEAGPGLQDLTGLLWSSIDNDDSRDLDQVEWAERSADGIRVLVGIADVDSAVAKGTPIDDHAASETTTVYAGIRTFPMLPERLSTDQTSLNEGAARVAVVIEMMVAADGSIGANRVYRAMVRNAAQLTYGGVGPWLEGKAAAPAKVAASAALAAQLQLQNEVAHLLRTARDRMGALTFDRAELQAVVDDGKVRSVEGRRANTASRLIEDFMIGANEVMAQTLRAAGVASIRRIVKSPERWPRMVELAERCGDHLPAEADAAALNAFLVRRKKADPAHFADVSLAVLKLMGPGEYVAARPGAEMDGHFGLAAHDYTHSTAPNRRFADLVIAATGEGAADEGGGALHGRRIGRDRAQLHAEGRRGAEGAARHDEADCSGRAGRKGGPEIRGGGDGRDAEGRVRTGERAAGGRPLDAGRRGSGCGRRD